MSSSCRFRGLSRLFQSSQSRAPKPFEELDKILEAVRPHHIEAPCANAPLAKEPSLAQHRKMLGNSRPRHLEPRGDRSSRHFTLANELHDRKPGFVAERLNFEQYGQSGHLPPLVYLYVRNNLRQNAGACNTSSGARR